MKRKIVFSNNNFSSSLLPSTRRKQFSDILKNDFMTFVKLGILSLLFALPFLAFVIIQGFVVADLANSLQSEGKEVGEIAQLIMPTNMLFIILKCVGLIIYFIGLSGISRVIKVEVYNQGVLFGRDFIQGIKENFKNYLITGFILALILFFLEFMEMSLPTSMNNGGSVVIIGLSIGISFGFILPIFLTVLVQTSIYTLSYFKNLVNSYRISIRSFLPLLLFILLPLGLYLIRTIKGLPILVYGTILLIIFLIVPIYYLGLHLYLVSRFDKFINQYYYKEIYLKGLAKKENVNENY